jgi:hypothetical protein
MYRLIYQGWSKEKALDEADADKPFIRHPVG